MQHKATHYAAPDALRSPVSHFSPAAAAAAAAAAPMSFEGIDEWDENFLDEAIRIELEAISSRNPPPSSNPLPPSSSSFPSSSVAAVSVANPPLLPPVNLGGVVSWRSESESFTPIPVFGLDDARNASTFGDGGGFSPPRVLSQRQPEKHGSGLDCVVVEPLAARSSGAYGNRSSTGRGKDKEVERLKRELGRLSKQLGHLEHECTELRRDRAKKDEQLRRTFSEIEAKDVEIQSLRRNNQETSVQSTRVFMEKAGRDYVDEDKCAQHVVQDLEEKTDGLYEGSKNIKESSNCLPTHSHSSELCDHKREHHHDASAEVTELRRRVSINNGLTTSSGVNIKDNLLPNVVQSKIKKTTGTQTDFPQDHSHVSVIDLTEEDLSRKLLVIWGSPDNKRKRANFISKLLVSCSADFFALFRCMSITPSKTDMDCQENECLSDFTSHGGAEYFLSTVAPKVSRLQSIVMEIHEELIHLHDLIEVLLDLCTLDLVVVVHRSLHVLHVILQELLNCETKSNRRNVVFDQPLGDTHEEGSLTNRSRMIDIQNKSSESERLGLHLTEIKYLSTEKSYSDAMFLSPEDLTSIYQTMQRISARNIQEFIRVEAISIMTLILMGRYHKMQSEMFELVELLDWISPLFSREVSLQIRNQAVHLLFLFFNCPKSLLAFCSGGADCNNCTEQADGHSSKLHSAVSSVLKGLAECLASDGVEAMDFKLGKQVIILLAYIAASGKNGFDILLTSVGPQGANFLELTVQILASLMDADNGDFSESQTYKERTSLMREALILLNRLVSHPVYSRATLEALTSNRSTANLTIDVANWMPQDSRGCRNHDAVRRIQMEAEVADLVQLFRKRVLAFLAEN